MRQTKGQTGKRRSHHHVSMPQLAVCASCGNEHVRHTVCMSCGSYRGRQVIDVASIRAKKEAKKQRKREEIQQQLGGGQAQEGNSPAGEQNAEALSHTDEGSERK